MQLLYITNLSALLLATIVAASELRGRSPHRYLLPTSALLALLLAGLAGSWQALLLCLSGALVCGLVPGILALLKLASIEDAALLATCGALLGPFVGLEAELYAFALGTMLAVGQLLYQGTLLRSMMSGASALLPRSGGRSAAAQAHFRFAPSVCVGVLLASALHWSAP